MMFILNRIALVLNGLAILGLLIAYVAPFVSPELLWHFAFFGLAYPVLLALNILFVIYWIVVFKFKFMYSLLAIMAGYNYIPYFAQINAKKTIDQAALVRVSSFNAKFFGVFEGRKPGDAAKFIEVLEKVDPHIACFQEFAHAQVALKGPLYRTIKNTLSHKGERLYITTGGPAPQPSLVIISRFPIIDSGEVEHEPGIGNYTIFADIVAHGDTLRIVNTHLRSIRFEGNDYKAISELSVDKDSSVVQFSGITRKLKRAFVARAKQADAVSEFIRLSPYPVILTGDFNDPPTSYAFRTIKGELKDAFVEAGSGLSRTYVGRMPSFRIDYILYNPAFHAFNYYAKAFEFSDHKMISAGIRIHNDPAE
jgi:endonuclease/exonuclease/phosphatase family metal-dependent hydrolase